MVAVGVVVAVGVAVAIVVAVVVGLNMIPVDFPEANSNWTSPKDLEGSCQPIRGFIGQVGGGVFDGSYRVVVAWKPTLEELKKLNEGGAIFLSVMGGLPPHYLCTSFEEAVQ